jgi:hypothetical protein
MPRHIVTFSMPWHSLVPAVLGVLMFWVFITVLNLFGYTQCVGWKFIQSAPAEDARIIGALENNIYTQTRDGTVYCGTQNGWSECTISTFVVSHKNAPQWFNSFDFIPEDAAVVQMTRAGNDFAGYSNIVLLENKHIWACPYSLRSEMDQLVASGRVIWIVIPVVLGFGCLLWFLMIFAQSGLPTFWDFWGRGTKIK